MQLNPGVFTDSPPPKSTQPLLFKWYIFIEYEYWLNVLYYCRRIDISLFFIFHLQKKCNRTFEDAMPSVDVHCATLRASSSSMSLNWLHCFAIQCRSFEVKDVAAIARVVFFPFFSIYIRKIIWWHSERWQCFGFDRFFSVESVCTVERVVVEEEYERWIRYQASASIIINFFPSINYI